MLGIRLFQLCCSICIQSEEVEYRSVDGECEITRRFDRQFEPFTIPDEAEYRGNTYVGAGKALFSDGVAVEIYSTPRNEDDPDGTAHYCDAPINFTV